MIVLYGSAEEIVNIYSSYTDLGAYASDALGRTLEVSDTAEGVGRLRLVTLLRGESCLLVTLLRGESCLLVIETSHLMRTINCTLPFFLPRFPFRHPFFQYPLWI